MGCLGNDQFNYRSSYVLTFIIQIISVFFFFSLAEKYCILVRNENGEPLLSQILYSNKMSEPIRNLAQAALANVQR